MENREVSCDDDELPLNHIVDEEDFRSCCGDEQVSLKESDDNTSKVAEEEEEKRDELDYEFSVKLFFKGVSVTERGDSSSGCSGIGVVLERLGDFELIQVQKKLNIYAEELAVNYLALIDGLTVALQNNLRSVVAVTDSELLYNQIIGSKEEKLEIPILLALRERVLEKTSDLDGFVVKLAPLCDLDQALSLARVAVGICNLDVVDKQAENCSICCEERLAEMMLTLKCTHKFCSHCMKTYVEGKVQSSEVPIRCPELQCKHYLSSAECKTFLPVSSFRSFQEAIMCGANSGNIYCPYPNCSFLLDPRECLSPGRASASSCSQSESSSCVKCPLCERFVCVDCGVPWHDSMSCEEFQILHVDERYPDDVTLHRLARYKRWRRCQQCRVMIELAQDCNHMTCRCGHEFCYCCGAEYREGQQSCTCAFWDDKEEEDQENTIQGLEQWPWDTFTSIPGVMDAYSEQERSQLALIQQFLAGGGFSLSDQHTSYQSSRQPPCRESSYVEAAMKDLDQLPWLERFVSVISDDYYEEYINSQ
ncbi:E3 ubiquitin-protein ligase RSL1 [Raphanus sativus]|uniref:RBR-type E3 ubiquitin transferase n=1 Tax=Raphanus sativus TaxID=3726 RepID=A0A6J0N2C6_RAPSA|nr:E3 ubiquitin-protein ligase RSL1 [Raphanus sativus]